MSAEDDLRQIVQKVVDFYFSQYAHGVSTRWYAIRVQDIILDLQSSSMYGYGRSPLGGMRIPPVPDLFLGSDERDLLYEHIDQRSSGEPFDLSHLEDLVNEHLDPIRLRAWQSGIRQSAEQMWLEEMEEGVDEEGFLGRLEEAMLYSLFEGWEIRRPPDKIVRPPLSSLARDDFRDFVESPQEFAEAVLRARGIDPEGLKDDELFYELGLSVEEEARRVLPL